MRLCDGILGSVPKSGVTNQKGSACQLLPPLHQVGTSVAQVGVGLALHMVLIYPWCSSDHTQQRGPWCRH